MILKREETGSRRQWKSMSEQRKRKDKEARRKRGMQRKRRTRKGGDTTGLTVRGDTGKVEKATLRSMKETVERGIETESDTQTNIKKGGMTERDGRGRQKGRRKEVLL